MSRNRDGRFSLAPQVDISRSAFKRSWEHCTTGNISDVIPIFVDEILPGDTAELKTSFVARLQTLIAPIMSNLYIDTYFYFVPNRLVWEHWQEFCGENKTSAWVQQVQYTVPQLVTPVGGMDKGTILDYMGVPTGIAGLSLNALPVRAYALIMSEYFRDENLQDPLSIPIDDTTVTAVNTGTEVTDVAKGGLPFKAAKFHDYFTSCLPGPQKGDPVEVSLLGTAPVFGNGKALALVNGKSDASVKTGLRVSQSLTYGDDTQSYLINTTGAFGHDVGVSSPAGVKSDTPNAFLGVPLKAQLGSNPENSGLIADMTAVSGISVNTLRLAFALQKVLEKDSRTGSRYIEILKGHFGVTSPDARLQRPEYLGGHRIRVNVNQVVQTSATGVDTPQGNVAGYSLTTDSHGDFIKSFTEHGYIIGVAVARYDHMYQQGLERMWSRKDRYDFYWPALANIGEQGVLNKEIYAQGPSVVDSEGNVVDEQIFGYQEAWADYRYKPSRVSGEMRSNYAQSLDIWHLGDDYASLPSLSESWVKEDSTTVDRVLAVSQRLSDQMLFDFYFDYKTVRPMPLYSIPGLIDHN